MSHEQDSEVNLTQAINTAMILILLVEKKLIRRAHWMNRSRGPLWLAEWMKKASTTCLSLVVAACFCVRSCDNEDSVFWRTET
jgi:hypothetical protein